MRSIKRTAAFKRDLKRESKGVYRFIIKAELKDIVERLAMDLPLEGKYRDHELKGNRAGFRECHIRPDLLLIYRLQDGEIDLIVLARLGSHSEILDL